jgi:signal transduction histidine kinase
MPISTSSLRRSRAFRHRFDGIGTDAAPVRYLQRDREEMLNAVFHAILLAGFLLALALFARSLVRLSDALGDRAAAWLEPLALVGLGTLAVVVVLRLVARLREIRDLRQELRELRAQVAALRDQQRRRD